MVNSNANRLTKEEYWSYLALAAKARSVDPHSKIGAVGLSEDGRVLGMGYNGLKSGFELENWMFLEENREKKADYFIHAESNLCALLKKGECHTICITQSCCIKCCQSIAALDIKRVIYVKEYEKCSKFKDFFKFYNIEYMELPKESKQRILEYIKDSNNYKELL